MIEKVDELRIKKQEASLAEGSRKLKLRKQRKKYCN
jgi:hypothetical protein